MDTYAPPVTLRPAKSRLPVILSGLSTTILTLMGVYLLNANARDFNIMGWYMDYILPVGAMIVGAAAASGYGVASWASGVKITKALLWIVLGLQLVAYFGAQYIEFQSQHLRYTDGAPVGFFTYYDVMARSFAWKPEHGDGAGNPLGVWGYVFRILEIIGFCGGGMIVPALLRKVPYCEGCQVYMRSKSLGLIPASVPHQKIKKSNAVGLAAYKEVQAKSFTDGQAKVAGLWQLATDGKTPQLNSELKELAAGKKPAAKLPQRIDVKAVTCRHCWSGHLAATLLSGHGKQQKSTPLGTSPVKRDFVQSMLQQV